MHAGQKGYRLIDLPKAHPGKSNRVEIKIA